VPSAPVGKTPIREMKPSTGDIGKQRDASQMGSTGIDPSEQSSPDPSGQNLACLRSTQAGPEPQENKYDNRLCCSPPNTALS
jgi:hypothetical protein